MKLKFCCDNVLLRVTILAIFPLCLTNAIADELPAPVMDSNYFYEGQPSAEMVELGKNLFFDKILGGDKNISCSTCHNPLFGTGDNLSLPIGAGGSGSGAARIANTANNRIVRNALPIYNRGAKEFTAYLNDGDFKLAADGTFTTPAKAAVLPTGLDNLLAAQALFPLAAAREMTGDKITNPISSCALKSDFSCVWTTLAQRLQAIPEYVSLFMSAYPDITTATDINIRHVANAISAYETFAFRSDDSPFDKFLSGDSAAMNDQAIAGMQLFYGSANCSSCHKGIFQTDHSFHSIAMPQIGPGRRNGTTGPDDGRRRLSGVQSDLDKYITPSLRNVMLTGPWGHDGAYISLEGIIRHHLDPVTSLNNYDTSQAILPAFPKSRIVAKYDFAEFNNLTSRAQRAATNELTPMSLTDDEVDQLLAFMEALTGESVLDVEIPATVPSGLSVAD